jgi:anthranilate/para-aminobenzoate synthase component I
VQKLFIFDHQDAALWIVASGDDYDTLCSQVQVMHAQVTSLPLVDLSGLTPLDAPILPSYAAYEVAAAQVKQLLLEGRSYQVNLAHKLTYPHSWKSIEEGKRRFVALCRDNPVTMAAYGSLPCPTTLEQGYKGCVEILSLSPERLLKLENNKAWTRPIAGTRRRAKDGEDPEDFDALMAQELEQDPKEQAEHRMLVDLARNDLARFCKPGTVCVPVLGQVVYYQHLMHLESLVEGQLRPGGSPWEALKAIFPGGTITGAPKIATMECLARIESSPRGMYTGSIGYVSFRGDMDFNIAIRTLVRTPQGLDLHVGGGITYLSDISKEYKETLNKAYPLRCSLERVTVP